MMLFMKDEIKSIADNIKFEFHKSYNGIYLTDNQVSLLRSYGFDISKYSNTKSLIFDLDSYLNESEEIPELEEILYEIAEFDYYHNTTK